MGFDLLGKEYRTCRYIDLANCKEYRTCHYIDLANCKVNCAPQTLTAKAPLGTTAAAMMVIIAAR
jgi:hypothetical protein